MGRFMFMIILVFIGLKLRRWEPCVNTLWWKSSWWTVYWDFEGFCSNFLMQQKRAKLSLGWTHFHSVISFNDLHAPPAHVCNAFCPFRGFYYSGLEFFHRNSCLGCTNSRASTYLKYLFCWCSASGMQMFEKPSGDQVSSKNSSSL